MKFISVLWSGRDRRREIAEIPFADSTWSYASWDLYRQAIRDEADARLKLYGRRSFWRTGLRSSWRA